MTQEAEEYPAYEAQRDVILQAARELPVKLVEDLPEIIEMIATGHVTIGEIAVVFELKLREITPSAPNESGYDVGQAAHVVKMNRKHAEIAEMVRS